MAGAQGSRLGCISRSVCLSVCLSVRVLAFLLGTREVTQGQESPFSHPQGSSTLRGFQVGPWRSISTLSMSSGFIHRDTRKQDTAQRAVLVPGPRKKGVSLPAASLSVAETLLGPGCRPGKQQKSPAMTSGLWAVHQSGLQRALSWEGQLGYTSPWDGSLYRYDPRVSLLQLPFSWRLVTKGRDLPPPSLQFPAMLGPLQNSGHPQDRYEFTHMHILAHAPFTWSPQTVLAQNTCAGKHCYPQRHMWKDA